MLRQISIHGEVNDQKKTQEAYRNEISGVLHNDAITLRNSAIEHSVQLFEGNTGIHDNDNSEIEKK